MIRKVLFLLLATTCLFATPEIVLEDNSTIAAISEDVIIAKKDIDSELKDSIWITSYENHKTYQQLKNSDSELESEIFSLEKKSNLSDAQQTKLENLKNTKDEIDGKLKLLGDYTSDPFEKLVAPTKIDETPKITNPFAIFSSISFLEKIKSEQSDYEKKYKSLANTVKNLSQKEQLLNEIIKHSKDNELNKKELRDTRKLLNALEPYMEVAKSTLNVYDKKVDEISISVNQDIKRESIKAMWVGFIVLVFFGLLMLGRHLNRKYTADTKLFYKFNKTLNILFVIFSILVVLFAYIENAGYLATILGFASAGIAIAMKEWFMSIIGWLAIFFGGSIRVGDRIRVIRDGAEYIGDIINISPLKITLYEDVTLTTFSLNRRAGRIIFIPNNYIFTNMISSYSHEELDTVWDGLDFVVTFDSNIAKVSEIVKEIAIEYSSKHINETRRQLNKLRMKYNIRNMSAEPKIFTFICEYGMKISVWYYTSSFSTLKQRSQISAAILEKIKLEDDITIAYPSQFITLRNSSDMVGV